MACSPVLTEGIVRSKSYDDDDSGMRYGYSCWGISMDGKQTCGMKLYYESDPAKWYITFEGYIDGVLIQRTIMVTEAEYNRYQVGDSIEVIQ